MARRWSYPHFTTFVGPQTLPVTPTQIGWLPKWQEPVRNLVAATVAFVAFCPQPPPTLPVTPNTLPPQAQQASPSLLAARVAWNDFAWAPQPPPSLPVTPSSYSTAQQFSPILLPPRAVDPQFAWDPQFVSAIAVLPFGWNQEQFAPPLLAPRGLEAQLAYNFRTPPNLPVTPTSYGFQAQQFAPTLLPARAPDSVYIYDPQVIIFTTPVPYGWGAFQFAPTLLAPRALDAQFAWNPQALSLPITPKTLGFWVPWHDIIRTPDRRDASIAWSAQPISVATVPYGWIAAQFSPPVLPVRATDSPYIWTPRPLSLPVTPSQLGFWNQFHDIIRTPDRRDPAMAWAPQSIVPPIQFGWWTPQYGRDPVIPLARATPSDLIWTPLPLRLPVTPTQLGFWQPFHEIVRTPDRRDSVLTWIIPSPSFRRWLLSRLGLNVPAMVALEGSENQPTMVCLGISTQDL